MIRLVLNFIVCGVVLLGVSSLVYAQTPPQQDTPQIQALANRLTTEINNNLTCTANVITLQEAIKKLNAELAEAKKPADKKQDRAPEKKKP